MIQVGFTFRALFTDLIMLPYTHTVSLHVERLVVRFCDRVVCYAMDTSFRTRLIFSGPVSVVKADLASDRQPTVTESRIHARTTYGTGLTVDCSLEVYSSTPTFDR